MKHRTNKNGVISRAAHERAVKAAAVMGIPVKRSHPEHPSVIRVRQMFGRQQRRSDEKLRRLPDLFRETEPDQVGKLVGRLWSFEQNGMHRCKRLGQVHFADCFYTVLLCKYHRERGPSHDGLVGGHWVGAHWVRSTLPALYRHWKAAHYKKAADRESAEMREYRMTDNYRTDGKRTFLRIESYWPGVSPRAVKDVAI